MSSFLQTFLPLTFLHFIPTQRPLTHTPTARSGCGLYSLVNEKEEEIQVREPPEKNQKNQKACSMLLI
jgi:hypothetical protein